MSLALLCWLCLGYTNGQEWRICVTPWVCSLVLWGVCLGYTSGQQVDHYFKHVTFVIVCSKLYSCCPLNHKTTISSTPMGNANVNIENYRLKSNLVFSWNRRNIIVLVFTNPIFMTFKFWIATCHRIIVSLCQTQYLQIWMVTSQFESLDMLVMLQHHICWFTYIKIRDLSCLLHVKRYFAHIFC
jgi:hypothetical protein